MEKFNATSLLAPGRKTHPVVRVLAIPLSILMLCVFSDTLHTLMFDARTFDAVFKNIVTLALLGFLFWPFSYVAVRGKTPRTWHPYQ
ncbi:hypothetical protein [Denitromonas iodatirespirans]|uniref:Uncharacterized protein n=1 Tax=Denitromonas iodatirespirans TaxID=2795389 RepID=A0A944DD04_DENI1|nr:hypothetical protein [Denitromonas iodatirespirans]MBT0962821.1 hypothetical protein [Denitromonas iodatirespirans]